MRNCKNCGTQLKDGARFCPVCGRPAEQPKQTTPNTNDIQPGQTAPNAVYGNPLPQKSNKKAIGIIGIVAGVLFVAVAVIIAVVVTSGSGHKPRRIYEYDVNGNIVKENIYSGRELSRSTEYDANGNRVKLTFYNDDGSVWRYSIYENDANGNCIKETEYDGDNGSVSVYYIYENDANGNCIKKTYYRSDGSVIEYYVYENDANGNCVKETVYDGYNGRVKKYYIYENDTNGNRVKAACYTARIDAWTGEILEWIHDTTAEYDADGHCVKETAYKSDGTVRRITEYEYDAEGWCVNEKHTFYNDDGTVTHS